MNNLLKKSVELVVMLSNYNVVEYLGVSSIKAYLSKHGVTADTNTLYLKDIEQFCKKISENKPSIVGFSVFCNIVNDVLTAAEIIKSRFPEIHICLGGPQTFSYSYDIVKDNNFVDSVISGEGEVTFLELAERVFNGQSLKGCLGVTYREEGEIIRNEERPLISDLDVLPFPDRDIFKKNIKDFFYISASRGCLGFCLFCSEPAMKSQMDGEKVRNRTPENIVDEIEYLNKEYKVSTFYFTDSTFEDPGESGRKKAEGVFSELIKRKLEVGLQIYTRAELITKGSRDYLKNAYKAGLECVYLGIEAGNAKDLKLYNKKATVEDNFRAIDIVREEGLYPVCGFISFNPYSTYDTLLENADFLYKSGVGNTMFPYLTRLEVLPQAPIANKMKKDGLINSDFNYRSDGYNYRFLNPEIGELFNSLKTVLNPTQFDIDNKIGMHEVWLKKHFYNKYEEYKRIFDRVNKIRDERRKINYDFFTQSIRMSQNGSSKAQFSEYCKRPSVDMYNYEMVNLFLKIRKNMKKAGIYNF